MDNGEHTRFQRPFSYNIGGDPTAVASQDLQKLADIVQDLVAQHILVRWESKVVMRVYYQPVWRRSRLRIERVVVVPV